MSRAFVKEDGPTRWEAPVVSAYQVRQSGDPTLLRQGDDLLELLHWLETQEQPTQDRARYELRDRVGVLLAHT